MQFLRKIYLFLLDSLQSFLFVLAIFSAVYFLLFRPFQVSGDSMHPNFHDKQYILTNIIGYEDFFVYKVVFGKPKLGDVIVFRAPPNKQVDYVKRVIGMPGDMIEIKNGNVYLNEKILNEIEYLNPNIKTYGGSFLKENVPATVPENSYFVMGDNRPESSDSRDWGFVPIDHIVGISMLSYWPLNKMMITDNPYD